MPQEAVVTSVLLGTMAAVDRHSLRKLKLLPPSLPPRMSSSQWHLQLNMFIKHHLMPKMYLNLNSSRHHTSQSHHLLKMRELNNFHQNNNTLLVHHSPLMRSRRYPQQVWKYITPLEGAVHSSSATAGAMEIVDHPAADSLLAARLKINKLKVVQAFPLQVKSPMKPQAREQLVVKVFLLVAEARSLFDEINQLLILFRACILCTEFTLNLF